MQAKAAIFYSLVVLIILGHMGLAHATENDSEDMLAPLVSMPTWTGTIEVICKKDEKPKPETKKGEQYVFAWETMPKEGELTTQHEEHSYIRVKITIRRPSPGETGNNDVTGTIENRYSKVTIDRRTQDCRCRPRGGNSYIGKVTRTESKSVQTKDAAKGAFAKTELGGQDLGASIRWRDDGWHVILYVKSKKFEADRQKKQETIVCSGSPIDDTPPVVKDEINSDQMEFDIDTKNTNQKAKALSGGAVIPSAGKEYNVNWSLMLK